MFTTYNEINILDHQFKYEYGIIETLKKIFNTHNLEITKKMTEEIPITNWEKLFSIVMKDIELISLICKM